MLSKFYSIKINFLTFIKFLFYAFPFFMLTSSSYISFYVTILTISALIFFYYSDVKIKLDLIDYLLFYFFLLSLFSTLINIETLGYFLFLKSIFNLRFVLFFFVIRNLLKFKFVSFKILAFTTLIASSFLSLDIIYQHLYGHDLFGYEPFDGRYNGIFEHEAIAGGYIQKIFLISLLYIILSKINYEFIFITFFINISGIGILLSLDRMPFLIYLFILIILIIIIKEYRFIFLINFFVIILTFILLFKNYDPINKRYYSLKKEINFSKLLFFLKKEQDQNTQINIKNENKLLIGDYNKIYKTAYYLWLEKPIIGSGSRSFGIECNKISIKKNLTCSTHPHNIYFEIIISQGLLGLIIFIFFIILLIRNIINALSIKKNKNEKIIILVLFTILISELWPLRTYGSIFQTVNGTMFWFLISLISSIKFLLKNNLSSLNR